MKRESSRYQQMALLALFVRPITDHQPNLAIPSFARAQRGLRLVFGRRPNSHGDLAMPQRTRSWKLVLVLMLTMVGLIAMVWPLV
jgi:hypothetical protein